MERVGPDSTQAQIDLLNNSEIAVPVPKRIGLERLPWVQPWSVSRLKSLFLDAAKHPSSASLLAARIARHRLSSFWISAPVDYLEELYEGELGHLQKLLLSGPLAKQELAGDEQSWARKLRLQLEDNHQLSHKPNLLLALIPYCQPGDLFRENYSENVPDWLQKVCTEYFQPGLISDSESFAGLLEPSRELMAPLSETRGDKAMAWFQDDEMVQDMFSLVDAFLQDSSSEEIIAELAGLRAVLAQLWLDVDSSQLQTLFHTHAGDVTIAIIKAGFGKTLLDQQDQQAREHLAKKAHDFNQPNAPAVIMAMLMFYPLERVSFKSTNGLPEWFVTVLNDL